MFILCLVRANERIVRTNMEQRSRHEDEIIYAIGMAQAGAVWMNVSGASLVYPNVGL